MKNLFKLSLIAFSTMFIISSCNFEKRLYMKGYHIEAKKNNNKKSEKLNYAEIQQPNNNAFSSNEVKKEIVYNFNSKLNRLNDENQILASTQNITTNPKLSKKSKKENTEVITNTLSVKESKKVLKESRKSAKEFVNKIKKEANPRGGNDKTTLILLWVFLGGFAAHRWYAGKPVGANILFILTAGGCLVWAIIDLVKILKDEF